MLGRWLGSISRNLLLGSKNFAGLWGQPLRRASSAFVLPDWLSSLFYGLTHIFNSLFIFVKVSLAVQRWSVLLAVAWLVSLSSGKVRLVSILFLDFEGACGTSHLVRLLARVVLETSIVIGIGVFFNMRTGRVAFFPLDVG